MNFLGPVHTATKNYAVFSYSTETCACCCKKYVIVQIQLRSVQAAAKKLLFFSGICTSCC